MAVNIGEGLLENSEQGQFQIGRETIFAIGKVEIHDNARSARKALQITARCANKTQFINERRMKEMRHGAGGGDSVFQKRAQFGEAFGLEGAANESIDNHLGGHEILTQAVVQFAGDPSPLLILCVQELSAEIESIALGKFALRQLAIQAAVVFPEHVERKEEGYRENPDDPAEQRI